MIILAILIITLDWLMMQRLMPHVWPVVFRKRCINEKLIGARSSVSSVTTNAVGGQSGPPMVDLDMELSLNVRGESRNYSVKLLERKFIMTLITDLILNLPFRPYLIFITINKSVTPVWYHIFFVMVTAVFYCPFLHMFYAACMFYGTAFMYNHAILCIFSPILEV